MPRSRSGRAAGVAILACVAAAPVVRATARGATTCADLAALAVPDVTIVSAQPVEAGRWTAPGTTRGWVVPAFCRVAALAAPSADSRIAIEIWIPDGDAWNGRLLGTGNGGFAGAIGYGAMAAALARGYAVVGTDTGHTGDQLLFGNGHPEKVVDWSYRAVHVMTDLAKLVVRSDRGRFPDHAYFDGCSTGGQQALSEAQRFPHDYDGIVAGDPGNDRAALILGFLWSWLALHDADGQAILPASKLPLLTRAAVAACDARDGLRDGLIADPRACTFDPATLRCQAGDADTCLTPAQVAAVAKVYRGATNSRTGAQIFPGWPRGSEQGWGGYLINPPEPARLDFFRYFAYHDPHWDWRTFDWDRDVAFVEAQVPFISAISSDLWGFRSNGGKLLMYTGWADPVVPPQDTVNYYDAVVHASGGLTQTQTFFRFFPVAGMGHCMGGPGPDTFDALSAVEAWVERGTVPVALLATHATNGQVDRARPICAFPAVARYRGSGNPDRADTWTCARPVPRPTRSPGAAR